MGDLLPFHQQERVHVPANLESTFSPIIPILEL